MGQYYKKRRSGENQLFIQISPSEFLSPFFENLLGFQIMDNYHNLRFVEVLIGERFINISATMYTGTKYKKNIG